MYQANTQQGIGTMLMTNNAVTGGAPQPRRMESCLKRFEQLVSSAADIAQMVENLANNFAGQVPQNEPPQTATPAPNALIGTLETLADQISALQSRMLCAIQRLQEL